MTKKDTQRFAELEYTLQEYFDGKVSKVMTSIRNDLNEKQSKELSDYQKSPAYALASANPSGLDWSFDVVSHTGEWSSKIVDDYLDMCREKLHHDKAFQQDLLTIAAEWRDAVIAQIGRDRYDELCHNLGDKDMANAYVGARMENLMIQKLIKDKMPQGTVDYILKKAAKESLWGLWDELSKSDLEAGIEAKSEAAYNSSTALKFTAMTGSAVIDAASTAGLGSWRSFAKLVGADVLLSSVLGGTSENTPEFEKEAKNRDMAISKAVFGSDTDVFADIRKQSAKMYGRTESLYLENLNTNLNNKIITPKKSNIPMSSEELFESANNQWKPAMSFGKGKSAEKTQETSDDIPLLVAPGQEEAYLADQAKIAAKKQPAENTNQEGEAVDEETSATVDYSQSAESSYGTTSAGEENTLPNAASSGWDKLMSAFGLEGFGGVWNNAGYVISRLPDVLFGMFTGKNQSMNMGNSLMPIAAILAGMFVKNPMLKLALIGMGGANLFNKAGHESLGIQQGGQQAQGNTPTQYRQYADETLNPRITNPVLQGTTLIANIDNVPCSIQLTQNVVNAHNAGALPLNTLSNAVLAKYDAQQAAERHYSQVEQQTLQQNQTETIHRSR